MTAHPLITSLKNLTGNARACVYTEPLWGIPYNLFGPYASVYMLSLGLKDAQIGLILSLSMVFQVVVALFSGIAIDKLGRRRATFLFDLLGWSLPCLIWAAAQNFTWFVVAALFNSLWRVTMNSWTCLLVEDTEPVLLVDIYSWVYISGLLAGFITPLGGLLIHSFSLVPTLRGLYIFGFLMMTAKFVFLYISSRETRFGQVRMRETRSQSVWSALREYRGVFRQLLQTPRTLYTLGIMLLVSVSVTINTNFWGIIVTEKIHIPAQDIALYPFVKSLVMLLFFFLVMPKIRGLDFKQPMLVGFACFIASQLVLVFVPEKGYLLLLVSIFLEACALASVNTWMDRMTAMTVDPQERARIMALIYVVVIVLSSPFGWIAGSLSQMNRILPFVLNIVLLSAAAVLTYRAARYAEKREIYG